MCKTGCFICSRNGRIRKTILLDYVPEFVSERKCKDTKKSWGRWQEHNFSFSTLLIITVMLATLLLVSCFLCTFSRSCITSHAPSCLSVSIFLSWQYYILRLCRWLHYDQQTNGVETLLQVAIISYGAVTLLVITTMKNKSCHGEMAKKGGEDMLSFSSRSIIPVVSAH